jgi:hypothetical protein
LGGSLQSFYFWRIEFKTWLPGPIMCSDWLKFQRTPLKPLAKYTPLMKNRNRSLLDLIKEHYFCMFIYYHWVNTIVGGFVSSEIGFDF